MDLDKAKSNDHVDGPRMLLRPTFPNVPIAGNTNAAGLSQFVSGRPDLSLYGSTKTWFARWLLADPRPVAVKDLSVPVMTVNGGPEEKR